MGEPRRGLVSPIDAVRNTSATPLPLSDQFPQSRRVCAGSGAPQVKLHGAAADLLRNLGGQHAFVSLSDDGGLIQAFAVLV